VLAGGGGGSVTPTTAAASHPPRRQRHVCAANMGLFGGTPCHVQQPPPCMPHTSLPTPGTPAVLSMNSCEKCNLAPARRPFSLLARAGRTLTTILNLFHSRSCHPASLTRRADQAAMARPPAITRPRTLTTGLVRKCVGCIPRLDLPEVRRWRWTCPLGSPCPSLQNAADAPAAGTPCGAACVLAQPACKGNVASASSLCVPVGPQGEPSR